MLLSYLFNGHKFKKLNFVNNSQKTSVGPAFFRGSFSISGTPHDTYLRLDKWSKGVVWVNGFNLGRYWEQQGPQHTLYLPAPLLLQGTNDVVIFELHQANANLTIEFLDGPLFYTGQLCDPSSSATNSSNVVVFHNSQAWNANQLWTLTSSDTLVLRSNTNLCLQQGPSNDPSSGYPNIEVNVCDGSRVQQFTYNSTSFALQSRNNNQCLDITGGGASDGTNVETYPCSGGKNQQWTIEQDGHVTSNAATVSLTVCPVSQTPRF